MLKESMEEKGIKTVVLEDDYIKNVIRSGDTPGEASDSKDESRPTPDADDQG